MNEATLQTIMNYVITFLSTGVGATVITIIIKAIVSAIAGVKAKKYSKLTDADKTEIVDRVADRMLIAIQDGVSIDVDGMIDRATNKRLTAIEDKSNEFTAVVNNMLEIVKAQGNVLCELKTPSQIARGRLQELIGNAYKAIDGIPQIEQPKLQVKQPEQEAPEIKERKAMY